MNIIDELRRRVVADLAIAMESPETPFSRGTIFAFELTLADIDSLVAAEAVPAITDLMANLEKSLAFLHRDNGPLIAGPDVILPPDIMAEVAAQLRERTPAEVAEDDNEAAMQARADAAMADRAFDALGVEG